MDVTDIEAGVDFIDVLQRAVGSCDALLAIIGAEWLSAADRSGRRRLDNPRDFLRVEIATALNRNVRVIPVLVEGAAMPAPEELPVDLEKLTRRQAIELRDSHWNADVDALSRTIERLLRSGAEAVAPAVGSGPRRSSRVWWRAAGAVGVAAAGLAGIVALDGRWGRSLVSEPEAPPPSASERLAPAQSAPLPAAAQVVEAAKSPPSGPAPATPAPSPAAGTGAAPKAADGPRGASRTLPRPERPPAAAIPVVVGRSLPDARDMLSRAGVAMDVRYVADRAEPGTVVKQEEVVADGPAGRKGVLLHVALSAIVSVAYESSRDEATAVALVSELRSAIADPRYAVRPLKSPRYADEEGAILYSTSGLWSLAATVAKVAGPWVSRTYGRGVRFTPIEEPRVSPRAMIVALPGRASRRGSANPKSTLAAHSVVGQPLATARDILTRAGFDVKQRYVEDLGPTAIPGTVSKQEALKARDSSRRGVLLSVVALATVAIYFEEDVEAEDARGLASHLRKTLGRPDYFIRVVKSQRAARGKGEVRYGSVDVEPLTQLVAQAAGPWLSRRYGSRVTLARVLTRMHPRVAILVLPARPGR